MPTPVRHLEAASRETRGSLTFSQLRNARRQFRTSPRARCRATNCMAWLIADGEMNTSCHMLAMNNVSFSDSGKSARQRARQQPVRLVKSANDRRQISRNDSPPRARGKAACSSKVGAWGGRASVISTRPPPPPPPSQPVPQQKLFHPICNTAQGTHPPRKSKKGQLEKKRKPPLSSQTPPLKGTCPPAPGSALGTRRTELTGSTGGFPWEGMFLINYDILINYVISNKLCNSGKYLF